MAGIERTDTGGDDVLATVAKSADDAAGRRALQNEAAILRRIAHPGVVALIAHTDTGARARLVTERVPGTTMAEGHGGTTTTLAATAAGVASVVADLHGLGIAHGSIRADHVICSRGRVVLCSFGRAGEATPTAMDRDVADLVVAVADIAEGLASPTSRTERRLRRRLHDVLAQTASRSYSAAELSAALAELAAEAATTRVSDGATSPRRLSPSDSPQRGRTAPEDPSMMPDESVPAPARPWRDRVDRPAPSANDPESAPMRRRHRNLLIGAAAGVVVVAAWGLTRPAPSLDDAASHSPPPTAPTAAPTLARTPAPTPPDANREIAVVGNLVEADGIWFEVGRSGDIVRVGDWDCDGTPTPAVLRPDTGEVFVFERWVEQDRTQRVAPVAVLPGAADLVEARPGPCGGLVVLDRQGRQTAVEVAS